MKSSEYLRNAKALIDSPEKWTKKENARNDKGNVVSFLDESAVCFCSMGAFSKVYHLKSPAEKRHIREYLIRALPYVGNSIVEFNDRQNTTHADVMSLFDRAIELAESEGD